MHCADSKEPKITVSGSAHTNDGVNKQHLVRKGLRILGQRQITKHRKLGEMCEVVLALGMPALARNESRSFSCSRVNTVKEED